MVQGKNTGKRGASGGLKPLELTTSTMPTKDDKDKSSGIGSSKPIQRTSDTASRSAKGQQTRFDLIMEAGITENRKGPQRSKAMIDTLETVKLNDELKQEIPLKIAKQDKARREMETALSNLASMDLGPMLDATASNSDQQTLKAVCDNLQNFMHVIQRTEDSKKGQSNDELQGKLTFAEGEVRRLRQGRNQWFSAQKTEEAEKQKALEELQQEREQRLSAETAETSARKMYADEQSRHKECKIELERVQRKLETTQADCSRLRQERDQSQKDNANLKAKMQEYKTAQSTGQSEMNRLRASLDEDVKKHRRELLQLQDVVQSEKAKVLSARNKNAELAAKVSEMETQVSALVAERELNSNKFQEELSRRAEAEGKKWDDYRRSKAIKHQEELITLRQRLEEMNTLRGETEALLGERNASMEQTISTLTRDHERQQTLMANQYKNAFEELETLMGRDMSSVKNDLESIKENQIRIVRNVEEDLTAAHREHTASLEKMKQRHDDELGEVQANLEAQKLSEIDKVRHEFETQLLNTRIDLQTKQDEVLRNLCSTHSQELTAQAASLKDHHRKELDDFHETLQQEHVLQYENQEAGWRAKLESAVCNQKAEADQRQVELLRSRGVAEAAIHDEHRSLVERLVLGLAYSMRSLSDHQIAIRKLRDVINDGSRHTEVLNQTITGLQGSLTRRQEECAGQMADLERAQMVRKDLLQSIECYEKRQPLQIGEFRLSSFYEACRQSVAEMRDRGVVLKCSMDDKEMECCIMVDVRREGVIVVMSRDGRVCRMWYGGIAECEMFYMHWHRFVRFGNKDGDDSVLLKCGQLSREQLQVLEQIFDHPIAIEE